MLADDAAPHLRVVTVTEGGTVTGTVGLRQAHEPPGERHLAVSVMLETPSGWILQQRAASKPLFAGRWANSCCTHPRPQESPEEALLRRVPEELGVEVLDLQACGSFQYLAEDPTSGLVEFELDLVFVGRIDATPRPNPDEVADWRIMRVGPALKLLRGSNAAPWALEVALLACREDVESC